MMVRKTRKNKSWGYHLIVNAGGCNPTALRSKSVIKDFSKELVKAIDMVAYGEPMIVMFGSGNKKGYSLVQLIETSNITAHFVEQSNDIYLDIFSCKAFKEQDALRVFTRVFSPTTVNTSFTIRQALPKIIKRMAICADTFEIMSKQLHENPYIEADNNTFSQRVLRQHAAMVKAYSKISVFNVEKEKDKHLSDIVFVANGGLSLPRLPSPLVILPWMKYPHRRAELPYLKEMFRGYKVPTIDFPGSLDAPFEGQAEFKWFYGGTKAVGGYGFRSTKKTFGIMASILKKIYTHHGVPPPEILVLPIESFDYYHLDVAMLDFATDKCIVHKKAFSSASLKKLRAFLGEDNVYVLDTTDNFSLNAVVDGKHLITHKLTEPGLKQTLETITGKTVKEVDTTEFEKSGGSVRCMSFDLYL